MASSAFRPLQETRCKLQFRRSFNASSTSTVHAFIPRFSLFIHLEAKLPPRNTIRYSIASDRNRTGFSSARRGGQSTGSVVEDNVERRVLLKDRERGPKPSSMRSKGGGRMRNSSTKTQDSDNGRRMGRNSNKNKDESPENMLRVGLDMCSKTGDVAGAIRLYDMSRREEVKLGKYHYAVLLYLCSSAAAGVVQPAKSGSGSRKLTSLGLSNEVTDTDSDCSIEPQENTSFSISQLDSDSVVVRSDGRDFPDGVLEPYPESLNGMVELLKSNADKMKINGGERRGSGIEISEDVKKYALQRGFEIYESMLSEKVPVNEATFTSVARMAMALGDGDMAFEIVKQMAESGESPKLRSYGPALSVFCNNGDVEKAFMVEKHMLDQGICPEEPELEALLKASVEAGRGDKVYDLLQKLRTSVRQVLPSTADLIEKWFRSNVASKVGKKKFSQKMITDAIRNGGGGWHGLGWLGKGIWTVSHTSVGSDGFCSCCGEKLVTIDLDPAETEEFAKSVASLALEREKHSSFEKFQKWLDYYGPFEAVVDAANIGLYSQRSFRPSKVNAVVNGIRQVLPSKRWPLIVLHNRRISGDPKMNEPMNKGLIEKWQNADALYATPTGSNDDWYWLYAAIKFRGLLVTNDEMRDHLFQLLGKDFFPKWKERHQVRFSFSETGPVFHMPPPCSVVIQESEKGHWHIPIASESISHGERVWLCITRTPSLASNPKSSITHDVMETRNVESNSHAPQKRKKGTSSGIGKKSEPSEHSNRGNRKEAPQETYRNLTNILSSSLLSDCSNSVLQDLDDAEGFGGCTIDYQI